MAAISLRWGVLLFSTFTASKSFFFGFTQKTIEALKLHKGGAFLSSIDFESVGAYGRVGAWRWYIKQRDTGRLVASPLSSQGTRRETG